MPASFSLSLRMGSVLMLLSVLACDSASDEDPQSTGGAAAVESGGHGEAGRSAAGRGTSSAGNGPSAGKASPAEAGRAGVNAAGSGGAALPEDAGLDDEDAAVSCEGEIVADQSRCLQDDAFCYPLGDGRYCTGPQTPECPRNSTPIAKDVPCPERTDCFDLSESVRCARSLYTLEECAAAGGVALSDPGDGSLVCPNDATALGAIVGAGWDEGGLCCPAQKPCGARAGDTCKASEYCAYQAGQLCGQADAQATCQARPTSCSASGGTVCGCDQRNYRTACEAHLAGVGVFADDACRQGPPTP